MNSCTAAWISNDKEVYGAGLAKNIHTAADSIGLKIAGDEGFDSKAANYRSLGQKIKSAGADCAGSIGALERPAGSELHSHDVEVAA